MPDSSRFEERSHDALIAEVRRRAARRRLRRRVTVATVTGLAFSVSIGVPVALSSGGRPATIKVVAPPAPSTTPTFPPSETTIATVAPMTTSSTTTSSTTTPSTTTTTIPPAEHWSELSPATSPPWRNSAAIAYDPANREVVLFGGNGAGNGTSGILADTWAWNGSTWSELAPPTSPSPRFGSTMAYDPVSANLILFGGYGCASTGPTPTCSFLGDTWSWNGSTWTELSPPTSPTARNYSSMAYDPATGNIVLFGEGNSNSGTVGDTWTWNGSTWRELSPPTSPPALSQASMAYDPAIGAIVLFGGYDLSTGQTRNDTWTWNGKTWTLLRPPTNPPGRAAAMMTYDSAGDLILFGGLNDCGGCSATPLGDTWTWNGSTWTELSPFATSPSARAYAAMTYDTALREIVLFSGNSGTVGDNADTWTYSPTPV